MVKKAQLFTLVSIALIFLLLASYEIYSIASDRQAVKTRVKTMENFLFSTEQNLERQLYISGYRTVFLAEAEILNTGAYINNFNSFFQEAVYNGTVNGNSTLILFGATLSAIQSDIQSQASKLNLNFSFTNVSISIGQEDPWNLVIYLNFNLTLTDKTNLAGWNRIQTIKSLISINGFEDPVYLINTGGKVSRKINQTIYENFSQVNDLNNHLVWKYYLANPDAPSFIDRLEGSLQGDVNGIESIVYLPELTAQGIVVADKSCIDHVYFSLDNPSSSTILGTPSWFKVDSNHRGRYT